MKTKRNSRFFGLVTAIVLLSTLLGVFSIGMLTGNAAEQKVVYLSDIGNDNNDGASLLTPVQTLAKANSLAGVDGKIIISDTYTQRANDVISVANLEGFNQDCVYEVTSWKQELGADCTIDNITLRVSANWAFILCKGNSLTVGKDVKSEKTGKATVYLSIRGGGESYSTEGSTSVTLKGGIWGSVYGGTKNGNIGGGTNVTVYEGASITSAVSALNDASTTSSVIQGVAMLKLVGKDIDINEIYGSTAALAGAYLDLTEYTGEIKSKWQITNYWVVKDPKDLPDTNKVVKLEPKEPNTGTPTTVQPGKGVFYVSDLGDDKNDGKTPETAVKTLEKALSMGGMNPTVVIVDSYTKGNTDLISQCKIVGLTSDSQFVLNAWALRLGNDVTFENITLVTKVKYSYLLALGNTLTIEKGVSVKKGDGITTGLGIRGGGDGNNVGGDTCVILKSGEWDQVHGGTRNGSITGNTMVIVHSGAKVSSLNSGNNGTKEGDFIGGDAYIKLVGNPTVTKIEKKPAILKGTYYIDLSEYTATRNNDWNNLGATIITNKSDVPEFVNEHFAAKEAKGAYDLTGVVNPRFISDDGDDANDGLTAETPKKTIKALQETFKGCDKVTIVVVGNFTTTENLRSDIPYDLTSTCGDDAFIFKYWALVTNCTHIYNLNIIMARDYNFILHQGTPLKIGDNVEIGFTGGTKVNPGIRAGETGDYAMTDIEIKSGEWTVYAGTKNGFILGNSRLTLSGGTVSLCVGNDSTVGRIMGSTIITIKDKAFINSIGDRNQSDGFIAIDVCDYKGVLPPIPEGVTVINDPKDRVLPITKTATFINGYPDGTFLPEKVMTRAEAATVVAKISGMPAGYVADDSSFADVSLSDWYNTSVAWLESFDALDYIDGDKFDPTKEITRGEFVRLISKIPTEKKSDDASAFTDVAEDHPYYDAILTSAAAGLVTGYPDGTFKPDNTLKRSEIVTVLCRLSERNILTDRANAVAKFSDIDGHWAKANIIAASCDTITDNTLLWYIGDIMGANSPYNAEDYKLVHTEAALAGVDKNDSKAVTDAIEAYAEKRREEIKTTATTVEVKGTKYYVSANGNDANDGKSPETAWKSIDKVNSATLSEGDGVFFNRGDEFRGKLTTQKGVTYSAYGEGAKPVINGSARNYSGGTFWRTTNEENVYVSTDIFDKDVGLIVFDGGKDVSHKEIIGVKGFEGKLTSDLQMHHNPTDNRLYLYSVSDPNTRWTSTEIAPGIHGISGNGNNVTIDNICLKYFGAHGISYGDGTTGLTVQNCEIGWIGGRIQTGTTRFGNGVEIYIGCKDYTIDNCWIYQCYDAAVTHQYFQTRDEYVNMENIKYTNNILEYSIYSIEYVNTQPADKGIMKNVEISGNLLLHAGEGWGIQRPEGAGVVLQGWAKINNSENLRYFDNIVMTGNPKTHLVRMGVEKYSYLPAVFGNIFVAAKDTIFGIYGLLSDDYMTYNEHVPALTSGLENNTFIFTE